MTYFIRYSTVICVFIISLYIDAAQTYMNGGQLVEFQPIDIYYIDQSTGSTDSNSGDEQIDKTMTCGGLHIDQSCVIINSKVDFVTHFRYQSMECDNCTLLNLDALPPNESRKLVISLSSLGTLWQVSDENNETICSLQREYLGENSWYHIDINQTGCFLTCDKQPENIFYPLLIAFGVYMLIIILYAIGIFTYRSVFINNLFHRNTLDLSTDLSAAFASNSVEEKKQKSANQRLRSLDTVRGISIAIMIFVNYGGGQYTFFRHSRWNGLTVADLVFPWFIWMMGMSMALALKSQLRKIVSKKKLFLKIAQRSITLFALGVMLNTICLNVNLTELRIPGVLQRFGISYFIVASVHLFYACADDQNSTSPLRDIISYGGEWLIMLTFLAIHMLLMFLVHEPDCPRGYFGPGGLHDHGMYSNCTGGAAGYVDRMLLGPTHIYQHPSLRAIYHSALPYDPEGILGYFTSIFLVFLGLQAGKIVLIYKDPKDRIIRWMCWGITIGTIAGILCCFSKNDGWIPVNKNLWSVSFIFATGSFAFLLLTICYVTIDVYKVWDGAPFYQAGMNSILLYVGHELTHNMFPWRWQVRPTHMNELFMNLWGTSLWVIIAVWMHHNNTFITV